MEMCQKKYLLLETSKVYGKKGFLFSNQMLRNTGPRYGHRVVLHANFLFRVSDEL